MTHHKMDLIKQTDNCYEWECPVCDRHIKIRPGEVEVINSGDQSIQHSGSSKGLSLVQRIKRLM